jgi:hypothetical protein
MATQQRGLKRLDCGRYQELHMSDMSNGLGASDRYGTPAERATLLITVASSSIAFMLAFNLGAYGEVFFDQIFTVWVTATIVFVGSIFSTIPPNRWPARLLLLLPSMWLLVSWIDNPRTEDAGESVLLWLTLLITLVALPLVAWLLVSTINPDFRDLPRSNKLTVAVAVVVFFAAGFLIGARNDVLLTCDDFKVSGNDLPANCVKIDPSS